MENMENIGNAGAVTLLELVAVLMVVLLVVVAIGFCSVFPHLEKIEYLKTEIKRTTNDLKKKHLKKKLRKVYVSCVPVVGKYIVKRMK